MVSEWKRFQCHVWMLGARCFLSCCKAAAKLFLRIWRGSLGVAGFELPTKQGRCSGGRGDAVGLECGLLEMVEPCSEDRGGDLFEISVGDPNVEGCGWLRW